MARSGKANNNGPIDGGVRVEKLEDSRVAGIPGTSTKRL